MIRLSKRPTPNCVDKQILELYAEVHEAETRLRFMTKGAIIKAKIISIAYEPNTPDYEKACQDAKNARRSVLCAIGEYDSLRNEYMNYIRNHNSDTRNTTKGYNEVPNSHEIIEDAYIDMYNIQM